VAASFLGVAGTLVGAAVGSIVASVATAVYQNSLVRTKDRLQQIAPVQSVVVRARGGTGASPAVRAEAPRAGDRAAAEGAGATDVPAGLGDGLRAGETGTVGTGGATGTVPLGSIPRSADATGTLYTSAAAGGRTTGAGVPWRRVATAAAGLFVVAVGVIFVVELLAGRPLSALVTGGDQRGTSVQRVVDPDPAPQGDTTPSRTPSPGEEVSGTPSAEPTPSEESPEPDESGTAPSESAEPSPEESAEPSAPASPGRRAASRAPAVVRGG